MNGNIRRFPQQTREDYNFKVSERTSVARFGIVFLFFLVFMIVLIGISISRGANSPIVFALLVLCIGLVGFVFVLGILMLGLLSLASETLTVSGTQLKISSKLRRKEYSCSDIAEITCGVSRSRAARIYRVVILFRDQKKFILHEKQENALAFAKYLLDMNERGVISREIISAQNKNKLRMFSEGKRWW